MVLDFLNSCFVFRSDTLSYNLRDSLTVGLLSHSPALIIVKEVCATAVLSVLWNSLPSDIPQSPSLNEFKYKLKNCDFNSSLI